MENIKKHASTQRTEKQKGIELSFLAHLYADDAMLYDEEENAWQPYYGQ